MKQRTFTSAERPGSLPVLHFLQRTCNECRGTARGTASVLGVHRGRATLGWMVAGQERPGEWGDGVFANVCQMHIMV